MISANDGLRFVLELCGLAALAYWGFTANAGVLQWVLGIGLPVLVAVVWATFITPNSSSAVGDPGRLLLELAVFGAAVAALAAAGHPRLAIALAAATAVHLVLTFAFDER